MRESIGAGWLMTIVISFVILFSGFLAISINYSKAFKVKDGIVERIQKNDGLSCATILDIKDYLSDIGYNSKGSCARFKTDENITVYGVTQNYINEIKDEYDSGSYNYCVIKVKSVTTAGNDVGTIGGYYKVIAFFAISLPMVNNYDIFNVQGETSYISYTIDSGTTSC